MPSSVEGAAWIIWSSLDRNGKTGAIQTTIDYGTSIGGGTGEVMLGSEKVGIDAIRQKHVSPLRLFSKACFP